MIPPTIHQQPNHQAVLVSHEHPWTHKMLALDSCRVAEVLACLPSSALCVESPHSWWAAATETSTGTSTSQKQPGLRSRLIPPPTTPSSAVGRAITVGRKADYTCYSIWHGHNPWGPTPTGSSPTISSKESGMVSALVSTTLRPRHSYPSGATWSQCMSVQRW